MEDSNFGFSIASLFSPTSRSEIPRLLWILADGGPDNVWIVEWPAAVNGRQAGDVLEAGESIKIATPEPYAPAR